MPCFCQFCQNKTNLQEKQNEKLKEWEGMSKERKRERERDWEKFWSEKKFVYVDKMKTVSDLFRKLGTLYKVFFLILPILNSV